MCCGHMCVAEGLLRASAPQEPFQPHTSTREERADGSPCSLWAGLQYNKLPSLFHQWKQAITAYPFTSLMGFSAMLLSVVMEHPLVKIHMANFMKIAANHSRDGGRGELVTSPLQTCWKMSHKFPVFTGLIIYNFSFDRVEMWSCSESCYFSCCPSWEPAAAELLQHCKISSTLAPISAVTSVKKNDTQGSSW